MAVGRISGPLLKANLLRNGVDLAFETDLLYLDVKNLRIGVKTNTPTHDLHVNGTTRTTTLEATNSMIIGEITASGNTISTTNNQLNLLPAGGDAVVYQKKIIVDQLDIENSQISANIDNTDITITPTGTGKLKVFSDMLVNGNIHATGNITADGSITIGDSDTDNISFNADIASNIIPDTDITYDLGSAVKRWHQLHTEEIYTEDLTVTGSFLLNGIDLSLLPGNSIFVSTNGDDTYSGVHQNDPYRTLKYALSQATAGTTIFIYPGVYSEIFPLTVPTGVTVRGAGIRSVTIQPTVGTISNDAFLLNGESTVEDLTVKGYRFNVGANTGYGFKFASNFTVTSRSPYVRNITVITEGSTTSSADPRGFLTGDAGKGAYLDGSIAQASSKEASMLFHSVTFITPGVDTITATNGVRVEWLNCFTYFANRGLYGVSGPTGFAGQGKTELRLSEVTGTFNVGDTLTYYASNGVTVLGSGVIAKKDSDNKIYLTGKVSGLETANSRGSKTIQAFADAKLTTAEKKFGSASLSLDGVGDYAFVQSNNDFAFGTGDFTIEGWFYRETTGVAVSLFDFRTAATQTAPWLYIGAGGSLLYVVNSSNRISTGSGTIGAGSWFHIALSRSGTDTRLFVNGTQVGSTYTDTNNYIQSPLTIGARYTGANEFFNGYIDDVRISKGVGQYITNFTAPTSILANDNFTVLLSRFDGENNSTTFIDESVLVQDVRSTSGGTAKKIDLVDYSDFGVEVRSIGSADVYGNFGAVGDGLGVIMYLIGQNMAYIGSGLRSDNDPTYVIQANEVVESNGAKIFYSSVDHKGDFRVGDLFYVNQEDGTVTFTTAFFNIASDQGLTFTNGSNVTYIDGNEISTGNLKLSGNTLESVTGDVNIASASDQINLLNNVTIQGNLDVVGNVTIGGNITIGDETTDSINFVGEINSDLIPKQNNTYDVGKNNLQWKDVYANRVIVGDISITNNQITTTVQNLDLDLVANGTGSVILEGIVVNNNEIRSTANADMILAPNGTGIVDIDSNKSVKVPTGTNDERPAVPEAGMIRFNTTVSRYEGYNGTAWVFLDGVSDLDGNTKVTAELVPGANDDTIRFYANGTIVADVTEQRFNAVKLTVDAVEITGSTVSNSAGGSLSIQPVGLLNVENFTINGTTIANTVNNGITTFSTSGDGYFRIIGAGGVVIPSGTSSQRPGSPVIGMVRYDTTLQRLEVYDGLSWVSAAGSQSGITRTEAEDIALQNVLVLG
jgi:phage protein U